MSQYELTLNNVKYILKEIVKVQREIPYSLDLTMRLHFTKKYLEENRHLLIDDGSLM
jgi:hypothetical protein